MNNIVSHPRRILKTREQKAPFPKFRKELARKVADSLYEVTQFMGDSLRNTALHTF
jgi:hypothetical protein